MYHLFFETLSGLGGKESEVLNFLVCAMRNSDNTYTGPMKKIAENLSCSKATVQRAMDTLTDKGFVAMEFDCVWRINPSMVIKGKHVRMVKGGKKLQEKQKLRHRSSESG